MRIRKHAKISPIVYAGSGTVIQTHVCQLNQSPWDVMTFPQSSISDPTTPPPPPPPSYQVDKDDSYTANGTFADYIGADKSAGSVKFGTDDEKERWDDDIGFDNGGGAKDENEKEEEHLMKNGDEMLCCKREGNGWQCRRNAKEGNSLCEHHTTQLKSYSNSNNNCSNNYLGNSVNNVKKSEKSSEGRRRARPKKPAAASSSNPYEFYYYSGFGPRWGKKRGPTATTATAEPYSSANASDTCKNNYFKADEAPDTPEPNAAASPISPQIDNEGFESFDYVEYEEEEDDDDNIGETGKKRTRKPIKARSLKSLM